jgi:hypothetical protein
MAGNLRPICGELSDEPAAARDPGWAHRFGGRPVTAPAAVAVDNRPSADDEPLGERCRLGWAPRWAEALDDDCSCSWVNDSRQGG